MRIGHAFLFISFLFICSCAAVIPAQKANRIQCPEELSTDDVDRPLDGMGIDNENAVILCGHREDLKLAKRMRVSDFTIAAINNETKALKKIASFSAFDQRYVQLFPKSKEFEVISVVLRNDEKPIPIIRDLYTCSKDSCSLKNSKCVFKSDFNRDVKPIREMKDLKKWWLAENQDARLQQIYLSSLSGQEPARKLFDEYRLGKISLTGSIAELTKVYSSEELRSRDLCKGK